LVDDLRAIYAELCRQLNWIPRPWIVLAAEFRRITTGDWKPYMRVKFTDGTSRRVRVFPILVRPATGVQQQPDAEIRSAA